MTFRHLLPCVAAIGVSLAMSATSGQVPNLRLPAIPEETQEDTGIEMCDCLGDPLGLLLDEPLVTVTDGAASDEPEPFVFFQPSLLAVISLASPTDLGAPDLPCPEAEEGIEFCWLP